MRQLEEDIPDASHQRQLAYPFESLPL